MIELPAFSNEPKQRISIILTNNNRLNFYLEHIESQNSWFYSLNIATAAANLNISNKRLVLTPDLLYQHKNIIPFSLFIHAGDFIDPFSIDDFYRGRVKIYIYDRSEAQ